MGKLGKAVVGLFILWSSYARAQVQIIQASDLHSQYNHLFDFIKTVSHLQIEFKKQHPNGVSVFLLNGDVAGPSEWTNFDKGMSFFEMAARLSNQFDGFAYTLGNHDGWSFGGPSDKVANETFFSQTIQAIELFKKHSKHSGKYTTANVEANSQFDGILQPSIDVPLAAGRRLRVVGLIGKDILTQSNYNPKVTPNPIAAVMDPFAEAQSQIEKAANEGITDMYLMAHEGHQVLEKSIPALMEWKAQHQSASVRQMKLPVFFAAHTHLETSKKVAGLSLIESGSRYQFSEVILNDQGEITKEHLYGWSEQKQLARTAELAQPARDAIASIEKEIHAITEANSRPTIHIDGISAIRADLRRGPHWLGSAIADSLREAARGHATHHGIHHDEVFAFFTSDGYRRDEKIAAGFLTEGDLKSMHPLPNEIVLGLMSGRALRQLLKRMRSDMRARGDYSPQISSNLVEHGEDLLHRNRRSHFLENHVARPIHDAGRYLVAIDGFNGARVRAKVAQEIWAEEIEWLPQSRINQSDVIVKLLPETLVHPDIRRMQTRRCVGVHLF